MMRNDVFVKLESIELEAVLADVNAVMPGGQFHPATVTVLAQDVSFYPGYRFLDMTDQETVPHIRKCALHKPGHAVILDWTNEPIYALNGAVPLLLNDDTVVEYVRFFFDHVRGRQGRFVLAENVDDIAWREEPPPAARKAIGKMLADVHVTRRAADGTYTLTARMVFKNSLFKADIHVKPSGLTSLTGEELLIENMPVLDDTFGQ